MSKDKNSLSTNTLLLKLLEEKDMYGYEMIETLAEKSNNMFELKAGTLYPILHKMQKENLLTSYEEKAENDRTRKYYHITDSGKKYLSEKEREWEVYSFNVNNILKWGNVNVT